MIIYKTKQNSNTKEIQISITSNNPETHIYKIKQRREITQLTEVEEFKLFVVYTLKPCIKYTTDKNQNSERSS